MNAKNGVMEFSSFPEKGPMDPFQNGPGSPHRAVCLFVALDLRLSDAPAEIEKPTPLAAGVLENAGGEQVAGAGGKIRLGSRRLPKEYFSPLNKCEKGEDRTVPDSSDVEAGLWETNQVFEKGPFDGRIGPPFRKQRLDQPPMDLKICWMGRNVDPNPLSFRPPDRFLAGFPEPGINRFPPL